jgi:transposase
MANRIRGLLVTLDERSELDCWLRRSTTRRILAERAQIVLSSAEGLSAADYKRHGMASLYSAFYIASGQAIGRVTKRHRAQEFLAFVRQIDQPTPKDLHLHLILDNSSTHKTEKVRAYFAAHPRFHLHFTPTSASWLNAVESWFGQLTRRALARGVFTHVQELRNEQRRFIAAHNAHSARPFRWTVQAPAILAAVERAGQIDDQAN